VAVDYEYGKATYLTMEEKRHSQTTKRIQLSVLVSAVSLFAVSLQLLELMCMQGMDPHPHQYLNDGTDSLVVVVETGGSIGIE